MPKVKLKGIKTKGIWLEMLKPVKRYKGILASSKLGALVEDTLPCIRKGKELFGVPKFRKGLIFCIAHEGIYTVREINSLIEADCYKLVPSPKEKQKKKNKAKAAH